jgi:hypothetical protein
LKKYEESEKALVASVKEEMKENIKVKKESKVLKKESKAERKKPGWALTEKEAEEIKEQEMDNLLEFAYQLDYEKYIDDFEVRQALAVLKERVHEIKKDENWKHNFAAKKVIKEQPENIPEQIETHSVRTGPKSTQSQAKSIRSMADTIKDIKEKERIEKPDWNKSVKGSEKLTVEERAAIQLADQVLQNAPYLKGVHSKASIRKILEQEARAQLAAKVDPKVVTIKEREAYAVDPSNLPYLYRNEAI